MLPSNIWCFAGIFCLMTLVGKKMSCSLDKGKILSIHSAISKDYSITAVDTFREPQMSTQLTAQEPVRCLCSLPVYCSFK